MIRLLLRSFRVWRRLLALLAAAVRVLRFLWRSVFPALLVCAVLRRRCAWRLRPRGFSAVFLVRPVARLAFLRLSAAPVRRPARLFLLVLCGRGALLLRQRAGVQRSALLHARALRCRASPHPERGAVVQPFVWRFPADSVFSRRFFSCWHAVFSPRPRRFFSRRWRAFSPRWRVFSG